MGPDESVIIAALGTAVASMAGFIVVLYRTIIMDKNKQIQKLEDSNDRLSEKIATLDQTMSDSLTVLGSALEVLKRDGTRGLNRRG